jgi:hypothetical protein
MYQIKLINPHKQFGKYNCSLIFHDTTDELPDQRWEKKYPISIGKAGIISDLKQTLKYFAEEHEVTWEDLKLNGAEITLDNIGGTKTIYTI